MKYFDFLAPSGVLKDGTEPAAGIFNSDEDVSKFPALGLGASTRAQVRRRNRQTLSLWQLMLMGRIGILRTCASILFYWSSVPLYRLGPDTRPLERTLLRNRHPQHQSHWCALRPDIPPPWGADERHCLGPDG